MESREILFFWYMGYKLPVHIIIDNFQWSHWSLTLALTIPSSVFQKRHQVYINLYLNESLSFQPSVVFSWWFNVGLALLGICLSLAMFCIVYLEWFKGIRHYDQEYPAIPPITTAAFIAASCRYNRKKPFLSYLYVIRAEMMLAYWIYVGQIVT